MRCEPRQSGRRRKAAVGLAVGFVAAFFLLASVAAAYACSPSGYVPTRWYATGLDDNVTQNNGAFANIYVSSSGIADCAAGGHINETLWESVDNSANGQYWVEGGWTHGYAGLCGIYFYWARNTAEHGYAEHRVNNATPSVGTYEPVQVSNDSTNTWHVYFNWVKATSGDGSVADIDAANYSRSIHFGLESTSGQNYSASTSNSDLQYRRLSGTWSNSVDAGSVLKCDSPATTYWVTTNVKLRSCMNASC